MRIHRTTTSRFGYDAFGAGMQHLFRAVKRLDFEDHWGMLEASDNPFALAVMIHLRTLSTTGKPLSRLEWKLRLGRELHKRGLPEEDVVELFLFIDWIMTLPKELEQRFDAEEKQYEEEGQMRAISPFEQRVVARGL